MIIYIPILLKDIFKLGRKYRWPGPKVCPGCGHSRVWGHGYVESWFDGYDKAIELKRYRCPCCGCVIRMRPSTHLSRFQESTRRIKSIISTRIKTGRWPPDISVSRAGHWLRSLKRKCFALFGYHAGKDLIKVFDYLLSSGINPVSRSI